MRDESRSRRVSPLHVNTQLLAEGMAAIDPHAVSTCPNGFLYADADAQAQAQSLGIWKAAQPQPAQGGEPSR